MLRARFIVTGALLALAAAACGSGSSGGSGSVSAQSGNDSSQSSSMSKIAGLDANNHGQKDVTGQSSVSIEADSYYFEPSVLKGAAGQKVTVTIENSSGTEHNFSIASQNINKDLDSHAKVTTSMTFPDSGVLSFFCEYHKSQGMAGGLLVSGDASGAGAPAPSSSSTSIGWG
jgi:plastocyanin